MTCKHCGNSVKNGESFCAYCGTPIEKEIISPNMTVQNTSYPNQTYQSVYSQPQNASYVNQVYQGAYSQPQNVGYVNQEMYNQPQNTGYSNQTYPGVYNQQLQNNYNNQYNQNIDPDEELLKSYIGEKYSSFVNNKFNVPMFFLGVFYLIYRKTWLYVFIALFINALFEFIPGLDGISLLTSVAYAFLFNKLYIKHAKKKVQKIKESNPSMNFEQLKSECERKGGTNIVLAIIIPSILFVILTAVIFAGAIFSILDSIDNDVAGYKWKANDGSVIFLYDDETFIWYKEDGVYDDNYYTGNYEVYKGEEAIEYVANNLVLYGVTESEQRQLIKNKKIDDAMNNYYVIVLDNEYLTLDGVWQEYTSDTYYLGFYIESKEYLDLVNIKTANYSGFTRVYEL